MSDLTRKDALVILTKAETDDEVITRIRSRWCQISWRLSAQDLSAVILELNLQSEREKKAMQVEINKKLKELIGELS